MKQHDILAAYIAYSLSASQHNQFYHHSEHRCVAFPSLAFHFSV